jgi:uncharacterized delta-60 repeat protein
LANHWPLTFESLEDRRLLAAGMLDPTFGLSGMVVTDFGEVSASAQSVAVQSDGKVVVAGVIADATFNDWAIARYNADGTLDSTFGNGGKVITDFEGRFESAEDVALQGDGKIIVAGRTGGDGSDYDFALARYNADGTLDSSFNGDGKLTTDFGGLDDLGWSVALQSDGKIIVAGYVGDVFSAKFALARYNADGTIDVSFDGDGMLTTDFDFGFGTFRGVESVAVQIDGKIIAIGSTKNGSDVVVALARYNPDGSLDTSFDGDGTVTTAFDGADAYGEGVALQSDGKAIVAGHLSGRGFAVVRYNVDGTLDSSFDGDGRVITPFGITFGGDVVVQNNGKILVAGHSNFGGSRNWDFVLLRYNADGTLDSTFDGDGKVTTDFGASSEDRAYSMALQHDGRIILAGRSSPNGGVIPHSSNFALARYEGDPIPPPALAGDYNRSGTVDAADYVLWRNTRTAVVAAYSGADGDGDGTIDQDDYDLWRANFGSTLAAASTTALAAPTAPNNSVAPRLPSIDAVTSTAMPTTGPRNLRPISVSRNVEAFAASRDQALLAWLAAKPAGPGRALMAADFSESLCEPAADEISIEAARALDSAFGSLQDTD